MGGRRKIAFAVLSAVAVMVSAAAGYAFWRSYSADAAQSAAVESVRVASEGAVKMLSYTPGTADQDLHAARDLMTGTFKEDYQKLIDGVVIPGAKERQISTVASVPAASSVSASPGQAVVLLFVNQSVIVGTGPPTNTASSVKVTLDKQEGRWLISAFEPV